MAITTTIRMSEELEGRVSNAAKCVGTTTEDFILEAIAEKAASVEHRSEFVAQADDRFARIVEGGKTMPWEHVRDYLEQGRSQREAGYRGD